jgi:hypothetical protein
MVANGLIRKMWVRGPFLSGLPFTAEADFKRLLGPAKGIEIGLRGKEGHAVPARHW